MEIEQEQTEIKKSKVPNRFGRAKVARVGDAKSETVMGAIWTAHPAFTIDIARLVMLSFDRRQHMCTMIFEASISHLNGHSTIRTPPSIGNILFGRLIGLFPLGIGSLTLFVLLVSGGRPTPDGNFGHRVLGWIVVAIFSGALGVLPFIWGLNILFVQRVYKLHEEEAVLISLLCFAGVPLRTQRYPFSAFDRVTINPQKFGVFAGHIQFIVACDGKQHLDLSAFDRHDTAVAFATSLAARIRLPVRDEE